MNGEQALVVAEMRRLAASIGPLLDACKRDKQLSSGAFLIVAREDILRAVRSYNPKIDESQLELGCERDAQ